MRSEAHIDKKERISLTGERTARDRLERERRDIALALDLEMQPGEELAEGWQEIDSPSEREIREIEYHHREELIRRLRDVVSALGRISEGSYGRCVECGRKIARKRLDLDPAVALCLSCQETREGAPPRSTI